MEYSYDQLISKFIETKLESEGSIWKQAALAYYLRNELGVSAGQVAGDTGYSGRYINQLVKTYSCFPEETDRALDVSYSIHALCATTDRPQYWLEQVLEHGYSVRDLRKAIKGEVIQPSDLEIAEKLWDKCESMLYEGGPGAEYLTTAMRRYFDGLPTYTEASIQESEKATAV